MRVKGKTNEIQQLVPTLVEVQNHHLVTQSQTLQCKAGPLGVRIFLLTGEKTQRGYTPNACFVKTCVFSLDQSKLTPTFQLIVQEFTAKNGKSSYHHQEQLEIKVQLSLSLFKLRCVIQEKTS